MFRRLIYGVACLLVCKNNLDTNLFAVAEPINSLDLNHTNLTASSNPIFNHDLPLPSSYSVENLMVLAKKSLKDGNYQLAIKCYDEIIDTPHWFENSPLFYERGQARPYDQRALAYFLWAKASTDPQQQNELLLTAEDQFEMAFIEMPEKIMNYVYLGDCLALRRNFEDAIFYYEKAIELTKEDINNNANNPYRFMASGKNYYAKLDNDEKDLIEELNTKIEAIQVSNQGRIFN